MCKCTVYQNYTPPLWFIGHSKRSVWVVHLMDKVTLLITQDQYVYICIMCNNTLVVVLDKWIYYIMYT